MIRYYFTLAICVGAAVAAMSCTEVKAQSQPPKGTVTHRAQVAPTKVIFRLAEQGDCTKGEYLVAFTDTSAQLVVWGCAHEWGQRTFIHFADGDIGMLETSKWKEERGAL
jgi:hypothetical protein